MTLVAATRRSDAYRNLEAMIAAERCVVLDGGVGTEIQRIATGDSGVLEQDLWGTWAVYRDPPTVAEVHRRYVATGCNVISTDTWSILSVPETLGRSTEADSAHWMDIARRAIRLARDAVQGAGRGSECAVAFAISEEAHAAEHKETIELLGRVFDDEPPDLILLETLTLVRDPETYEIIEALLATGLPLWLSFRRCLHGVCGVYGQHWGPPEGDLFGRAARRFEEMGVGALTINCLPVDHVSGMIPWLRDFTDLPLGVYPNLGYFASNQWRFDEKTGPEAFAELALRWREEGAQIIGGCCGVTPEHITAVVKALEGTKPGKKRPSPLPDGADQALAPPRKLEKWRDEHGRLLYPLAFPELSVDRDVFAPTQGSFLLWKYLFESGAGEKLHCLDVGCGCGILSIQLALNGAASVYSIDINRNAVANTLANAFRNGVADRVRGDAIDLYHWEPTDRYDLIVASLYQMPVDPFSEPSGHRPLDYWGRNVLDHFIRLLPQLVAAEGRALMMQLSIISQAETAARLAEIGFESRVIDYSFFPFYDVFNDNREQIARVEELSDAHHLGIGDTDVMVCYLLEATRAVQR